MAVPGYSKHHTGYAIDVRSSTGSGFAFADTEAYRWLAADNFANAKAFGWVPSYPEGSAPAGPVPEPWEFVWAGTTNIRCVEFVPTEQEPFCDMAGSTFVDDIGWLHQRGITSGCRPTRYCTTATTSRGEAATMLWRLAGEPPIDSPAPFMDVESGAFYADAVAWLENEGITTGTSATHYSPDAPLTRAQAVTLLWRSGGRPGAGDHVPFADVSPDSYAYEAIHWARVSGITRGVSATEFEPERPVTRGEIAAFIHRYRDVSPS